MAGSVRSLSTIDVDRLNAKARAGWGREPSPAEPQTEPVKPERPRKYRNVPTTREINGEDVRFDSKKEAARYDQLVLLEKAGAIRNLRLNPRYQIVPATHGERPAYYTGDFEYIEDGERVVEDVKSEATAASRVYVLRRKLMLHLYGIRIRET